MGTLSRVLITSMSILPVQREGWLSDNDAVRRFTRRPNTIVDGFYLGQKDLVLGYLASISGGGVWSFVHARCARHVAEFSVGV